jgi:hypothetical protein
MRGHPAKSHGSDHQVGPGGAARVSECEGDHYASCPRRHRHHHQAAHHREEHAPGEHAQTPTRSTSTPRADKAEIKARWRSSTTSR